MRLHRLAAVLAALALVAAPTTTALAREQSADGLYWGARLLGRQALSANDGWAAAAPGTTGGSAATDDNVFVVRDRAGLVAALGGDNATNKTNSTPKIIYVSGTINGFEGPEGARLSCADLADPAYSLDAYLATYDPAVWGRVAPSGPLEEARVRSVQNQTRQTQINVGPNTTIVGLGGAKLAELTLMLDGASNSIVRNLTFADAHDCFPAWSPTDGATGNWNSQFDMVSVRRSTNVWVDHNSFSDGDRPDSEQPVYFGRPYQVHDGALDITHTSDLVTVSYNRFTEHDKTMLIGSTDNPAGGDPGRLRVTLHHNAFDAVGQRAPRVRFGKVDIYNNLYRVPDPDNYSYSWGVGVQSAIYAENNFFALGADVPPDTVIHDWGGTVITELGTWVRVDREPAHPADLLAAYNASHDPDLGADAGWTPVLRGCPVLPTRLVPVVVSLLAGADRLPV
jgi:pectate lyase